MREGAYVSVAMDAIIKRLELIMFFGEHAHCRYLEIALNFSSTPYTV